MTRRGRIHDPGPPITRASTVGRTFVRHVLTGLGASLLALGAAPTAQAKEARPAALVRGVDADRASPRKPSREYLIKAAIMFNLAKFTTWPDATFASANAPLRICVLGEDPFGAALESLQGKQASARRLVTTTIGAVAQAGQCQVLFVSASEEVRLPAILETVAGRPILTVADMPAFAAAGGIVGLTRSDARSGLEVNIAAAALAGVRLSSKLLRLAETVGPQTASADGRPEN